MKASEAQKLVTEAYNKLDEALAELKTAKRAVEEAEEMVGDAFSKLEEIPMNEDEPLEADEPATESEE